jgi:hypothetical protein
MNALPKLYLDYDPIHFQVDMVVSAGNSSLAFRQVSVAVAPPFLLSSYICV